MQGTCLALGVPAQCGSQHRVRVKGSDRDTGTVGREEVKSLDWGNVPVTKALWSNG